MKDFYKISELSRLYNLHTDTLRYYEEQKALNPLRGENNYRMYSIQDICNLNIIRSLRNLAMPMEKISRYINTRTVDSTLQLLDMEVALIDRRISDLTEQRKEVLKRAKKIQTTLRRQVESFELLQLPPRAYFVLKEDLILEKEIDFILKKLEKKHENVLHIVGGSQQIGAVVDMNYVQKGIYNHFSSVFFIVSELDQCDAVLPGGCYASTIYSGEYENLARMLPRLLQFVEEQGLCTDGAPLELYRIDAHETNDSKEYKTEVQVKVKPRRRP